MFEDSLAVLVEVKQTLSQISILLEDSDIKSWHSLQGGLRSESRTDDTINSSIPRSLPTASFQFHITTTDPPKILKLRILHFQLHANQGPLTGGERMLKDDSGGPGTVK